MSYRTRTPSPAAEREEADAARDALVQKLAKEFTDIVVATVILLCLYGLV